jgi:hypothetical protein
MSETIDGLERKLAEAILKRNGLYASLREVELEMDNLRLAISRHVAALHNSHVVEADEGVLR